MYKIFKNIKIMNITHPKLGYDLNKNFNIIKKKKIFLWIESIICWAFNTCSIHKCCIFQCNLTNGWLLVLPRENHVLDSHLGSWNGLLKQINKQSGRTKYGIKMVITCQFELKYWIIMEPHCLVKGQKKMDNSTIWFN